MKKDNQPIEVIDISQIPGLADLVNQVQGTGRPVSLHLDGKDVGVIFPSNPGSIPRRAEVLRILAENRREIDQFGVRSIAIFGSVARDAAGPESDVDVLVEFGRPTGLFTFVEFKGFLERLFGRSVDLVTVEGLREDIRDDVLREAVRAA